MGRDFTQDAPTFPLRIRVRGPLAEEYMSRIRAEAERERKLLKEQREENFRG